MIRLISLAALLVSVSVAIPSAVVQDTAAQAQALDCHANDLHYVIGVPAADGGTSYRVGDFTAPDGVNPCSQDAPFTREFTATRGSQLYFQAIADDLLVLTESTGPEYFLEVYDLAQPEPLLKVDAHDVELSELGIHYYQTLEPATPLTCSRYAELTQGGMGAIVGVDRFFSFATASVQPGKGSRCYQTP